MIRVKLPNGQTIEVQTDDPKKAAEAGRRYLALKDARKRASTTPGQVRSASRGATLGLSSLLDAGVAAAETGISGALMGLQGKKPQYGPREAFDAVRIAEGEAARQFGQERPAQDLAFGLGGGLMMPGGAALAKFIGPARGLVQTGKAALKGAGTGAVLGGVAGAATAQPGQVMQGAKQGATVGAITGGAAPVAIRGAQAAAGSAPVRTIARATNRLTGGLMLNPNREASSRLREALAKDGLGPDEIRSAMNAWLKTGASSPVLMDVAGENTRALLRGSAMKAGPARQAAVEYGDQVAADLQDNVIARTRRLTPDRRSAQELTDDLTQQRGRLATEQYAEPYATPVEPSEATMLALQGGAGRAAMQRARSAAEAQMRPDQVAEIDQLMQGQDLPALSAATLDRIRIAMGERAQQAGRRGANDLRAGLSRRTGFIDESLDSVPGLQPARDAYRGMTRQIEGVEQGSGIMSASPDEFAQLAPEAIPTAQVGAARAIEEAVGRPTEGATGTLNRIATSTNMGRNLETAFGPEEAANYRGAIGNEVSRLNNARFINPNIGSQTAGRIADEALVELPPLSKTGLLLRAVQSIQRGATLTDAEREAIVRMGLSGDLAPEEQSLMKLLTPYVASGSAVPLSGYAGQRQ